MGFDLICLGRAAVDLYGEQIGSRLEDMQSFAMSLGGSSANIAVGAARQGLQVAMLTRVGDEHMGRSVREALAREGVDTRHVAADRERLTGLVVLGIRDKETFPLIFYRENCADMALAEEDLDPAFIASSRALLITGTHLSRPSVERTSRRALAIAREAGAKTILDIDYRPVLWGLTGHGRGEDRFVADARVTEHLQRVLPEFDLIVGTEEEVHIAGGSTDALAALKAIRAINPRATIVMKRGRDGSVAFEGGRDIPARIEDGVVARGTPVEVLNVLGAGDAFMAGFLRGWLGGESLARAQLYANACGAFVVARHGCAPAMPTKLELDDFLAREARGERVHIEHDERIAHLHRATTRRAVPRELCVLAFDHRTQLEELARKTGAVPELIRPLKRLIAEAAERCDAGVIIDDRYGAEALARASGREAWVARPIEAAGADPLDFEGGDQVGLTLRAWPRAHVVKCLVNMHPADAVDRSRVQEARLLSLFRACQALERELLIEVIPRRGLAGPLDLSAIPVAMERIYVLGIKPDWWKLPPPLDEASWAAISSVIGARDPLCRGVLLLGLDAPEEVLASGFRTAACGPARPLARGFAVGRTIFAKPAEAWLSGAIDDETARARIAEGFMRIKRLWEARA